MARPTNPDRGKVEIVASPDQIRSWEAAAREVDATLSQWLRRVADSAARKRRR